MFSASRRGETVSRPIEGGATHARAIVELHMSSAEAPAPWTWPRWNLRTAGLLLLLFLGVVQIAGAYVLFVRGLRSVPAAEASLIGMLEPIANPLWVFLLLGERPRPAALVGGLLVLAAVAWRTLGTRGREPAIVAD